MEKTISFFDTHSNIKKLIKAGFNEKQAEAQTESLKELIKGQVATKTDLKELELKIEKSKNEILKWMATLLIAQAGIVAALVKIL